MSTIVRWVLNWIANNAQVSIYTSSIPVGHRLGGHDIPQVANLYIVMTVLIKQKPVWSGYFQAT
jgi:hypothetical protein